MEEWRDLVGLSAYYEVSSMGRVRSKPRTFVAIRSNGTQCIRTIKAAVLSQHLTASGYYKVQLFVDKVRHKYLSHRLVALAFLPNPENKPHVNHLDSVRTNNRVENLEWCTPQENADHAREFGFFKKAVKRRKSQRGICPHCCKESYEYHLEAYHYNNCKSLKAKKRRCYTITEQEAILEQIKSGKTIKDVSVSLGVDYLRIWKVVNRRRR